MTSVIRDELICCAIFRASLRIVLMLRSVEINGCILIRVVIGVDMVVESWIYDVGSPGQVL